MWFSTRPILVLSLPHTLTDFRRRLLLTLVVGLGLFALAHAVDGWAFGHLVYRDVYGKDWGRMFRVMGFLPLWGMAALALILHDWTDRARRWRGSLIFIAPTLGGLLCEVLKLVLRRERPLPNGGEYVFRSFSERPFSTGGLALPSSHVLVAFSAAAILAHLFPRARIVWYTLAAGCAFTRVLAQAHFLSDVVLAGLSGILVAALLWRWYELRAHARHT